MKRRIAFGATLGAFLVAVAVSPVGAIPGLPAFTSVAIVLIAGQILLRHEHFWIPGWLARRSVEAHRMEQGLEKIRPVARMIDHLLMPRLTWLTTGAGFYAIALMCLLIGLVTPILELIPLGGTLWVRLVEKWFSKS